MPQEEAHDNSSAVSQPSPRCEIEKAILDKACQDPGEVRYGGVLLCAPHAELLRLEERAEALLGSVFRMDEWMKENGSSGADEEFVGRIRHEREESVAALRLTRAQLRSPPQSAEVGSILMKELYLVLGLGALIALVVLAA
jgi:hypothetical protein